MPPCPSCGRDTGSNDLCPHCGADLKRRMRIRTFGLTSIVVALAGLAVLWFFATRAPIAQLKIGDVQSTSNYAYAQISGTVTRGPNYNAASQSLTFWVRDETGEIMVAAFRSPVQELIAADKIPAPGDTISVQGTLRVREAVPSLSLDSAGAITLVRATEQAARRDLASITEADALHGVTVRGVVRAIKTPYEGLKLISLRDASGPIDVAISADTEALLGAVPPITVGQAVQVIGTVTLYESTPQLTLNRGADLTLLNESIEIAKAAALSDLAESDASHWVRVSGTVENVSPFSAGTRVTLSENGQRLTVLFWQDLWTTLSIAAQIQPGAQLSVQGEVSVFHSQIEIVPEIDQDVALIVAPIKAVAASTAVLSTVTPSSTMTPSFTPTPASTLEPTSTPAAATTTPMPTKTPRPTTTPTPQATATPSVTVNLAPINALTQAQVGQTFAVRGKVVETASFSAGFKFLLDDGTGRIELVLYSDNYKFVPNRVGLNLGADVSVVAEVTVYKGILQLEPHSGKDVTILTAGSNHRIPVASINTLTKAGQIVAVEGTVTDVKGFSSGVYLFVDDGTGNIKVTIFNNIWAYVPNAANLAKGTKVRIVGQTDFFRTMEIMPALGYDVTIQ